MMPAPKFANIFGNTLLAPNLSHSPSPLEFERLWRAFMTARAALASMLVILLGGLFLLTPQQSMLPLTVCFFYLAATLSLRMLAKPTPFGHSFDLFWMRTVGVDLFVFAMLQAGQNSSINYTPLFALPVLTSAILGSMMMALGTSAVITLLLFTHAFWVSIETPWDSTAQFVQAALTGTGCFAIAFLASQLASRLSSVEQRAQHNQLAAALQRQVNELVIESMHDGVVVIDDQFQVRSANPAAIALLNLSAKPSSQAPCFLDQLPECQQLLEVVRMSQTCQQPVQLDVDILNENKGARHVRVHAQLTTHSVLDANPLCVVFIQDQREVQARVRTEKLVGMGRMSAAIAHEIRNPLAAIVQANALLSEELLSPVQIQLTEMIQQNAQRLDKTVNDILHLAKGNGQDTPTSACKIDLKDCVVRICRDWSQQQDTPAMVQYALCEGQCEVWFDTEHLRRVLINLLDNARRFASGVPGSIQVGVETVANHMGKASVCLLVWSDSHPLDPSVEQHLFEPFFSSDSRSTGLGLYICRELCHSHGAKMNYDRSYRHVQQARIPGNEFSVIFGTDLPPQFPTHLVTTAAT